MLYFFLYLAENGKEILSMNEVLRYLLKSNKPLVPEERLNEIYNMSLYDWQTFADEVKCKAIEIHLFVA